MFDRLNRTCIPFFTSSLLIVFKVITLVCRSYDVENKLNTLPSFALVYSITHPLSCFPFAFAAYFLNFLLVTNKVYIARKKKKNNLICRLDLVKSRPIPLQHAL